MLLRLPVNQRDYFKRDAQTGWITILCTTNEPTPGDLNSIDSLGLTSDAMTELLLNY